METDRLLVELGARVRSLRVARGLSRRALAARSGLSQRFLAQLEGGSANISVARLAELASALGTTAVRLLGGVEERADRRGPLIALLGVRGAGKSTVGRRLARRLRVPFVELDALVERAAGMTLPEIFAVHGEAYYRRLEREALSRFLAETEGGAVLAAGGGIVNDAESWELLRAGAITCWLRAEAEDHWRRVIEQGDRRPMARNPNAMAELRAVLAARAPLYARADHAIDTSRISVAEVVEEILRRVSPRLARPA